jgi:hypothetical protein
MRVLFLIVSSHLQPYARIQHHGQEKTWVKSISDFENVSYKYLISDGEIPSRNSQLNELHNMPSTTDSIPASIHKISLATEDTLIINSSLGWESILTNTLTGFLWGLENENNFDFIIRTNVSSYWNIKNTLDLLSTLQGTKLYAGHELNTLGTRFIAGDGIILSRDLVELICSRVSEINSGVIDDVAIGRFFQKFEILPMHVARPIVRTLFDCQSVQLYENRYHQVRCKVERRIFKKTFRLDSLLMKSLHANFRKL